MPDLKKLERTLRDILEKDFTNIDDIYDAKDESEGLSITETDNLNEELDSIEERVKECLSELGVDVDKEYPEEEGEEDIR